MTEFLGLSLVTWQTILIIGFPLIYGALPRLKGFFGLIRRPFGSANQSTPSVSWWTRIRKLLRLRTLFLLITLLLLFLQLTFSNPSMRNPFTLTKLNLVAPTSVLEAALRRFYRAQGTVLVPAEQQQLLQRLTSLDARLLFATLGRDSLLHCAWCRPPSSKEPGHGSDHLFYTLPRLGLRYALLLIVLGLMTTGASHPEAKRRTWRNRLAVAVFCAALFEALLLSVFVHIPSVLSATDGGRMAWDALFPLRTLLFAVIVILAWWSVVTEPEISNASAVTKLGLGVAAVAAELDTLINRLRLAALQRSALMRDRHYRTQTNRFWENAESQAHLAGIDESVSSLKNRMGLSQINHTSRDQLKEWIDAIYPDSGVSSES